MTNSKNLPTDSLVSTQQDSIQQDIEQQNIEKQQTESLLAVMQADMEKALQEKQEEGDTEVAGSALSDIPAVAPANIKDLDESQLSRVIEMAWEDRTPFSAIEHSYGLSEDEVIKLMRQELKPSSFRLWRERVTGRATKHQAKRGFDVGRAYCKTQYKQR